MADRLYRSRSERMIGGVAGGLSERLDLDPAVVRVVWVVLAIMTGGAFALIYLVMLVVVPEAPFDAADSGSPAADPWSSPAATGIRPTTTGGTTAADAADTDTARTPAAPGFVGSPPPAPIPAPPRTQRNDPSGGLVLGAILILVGAFFLLREYVPQVDLGATWPVLAIAAGVVLTIAALIPGRTRR